LLFVGVLFALIAAIAIGRLAGESSPLADGLEAPRSLTPLPGGGLLVAETGGGRLLEMSSDCEVTVIKDGLPHTLGGPGGSHPTGVSAAIQVGEAYYYVVGEFRGSRYSTFNMLGPEGTVEVVAGGVDSNGFPATLITNPYDLVQSTTPGEFLISDSGRNAVLRVAEDGKISEYALFPRREVPESDGRVMDVVPTGLAYGPDGALYAASLTGYPYPQGAAYVYRMEDHNGDGDALDDGETTVYAEGFSAATDLAFDEDGSLLVTEFSTNMRTLVIELGTSSAAAIPGRLVRWQDGAIEVVAYGLVSPTSVAVAGGRIFVSEEFAGRITEIGD
jgi:hypothetical protein